MRETAVDTPPSCPAAPVAVATFCRDHWGVALEVATWQPVLERRERAIRRLRSAGDPRAADAVGWLTLAGMLVHLPAQRIRALAAVSDPARLADHIGKSAEGGHAALWGEVDRGPQLYRVSSELEVVDASSRSAWAIVTFAGHAAGGGVVVIAGTPITTAVARQLLRSRISSALEWREPAS
jgi:hypothetical protein